MHDSALMASLLAQIDAAARRRGARRVVGVRLRLGPLAPFDEEHLREHWELAVAGGIADGAELQVIRSDDPSAPGAYTATLESIDVEV